MKKVLLLALFACLFVQKAAAQNVLDQTISAKYERLTILEIFQDLEKRLPVRFFYEPRGLPYYRLDFDFFDLPLKAALDKIILPTSLAYALVEGNGIVVVPRDELNRKYINSLLDKWKNGQIEIPEAFKPVEMALDFGVFDPKSQAKKARFSIRLTDDETKEPVVGATIRVDSMPAVGAVSDALGVGFFEVEKGKRTVRVSAVGYRETIIRLSIFEDGEAAILLKVKPLGIQEIVIEGAVGAQKTQAVATGIELLPTALIKELPQFMGEADVVKGLFLLPGVSTVGDGATGFNVRGGNIDQNLVLLDDIAVLNTSHVLGFFSVFNPDLVRSTNLYKGHVPAAFGGRASSVLDVKLRDGNFQKSSGGVGIGLAAAKGWFEGPLVKNRLAVTAGVRMAFSDWMLQFVQNPQVVASKATFYDANLKFSLRVGSVGSIILNTYRSRDFFRYSTDFGFRWSSQLAALSWKTVIGRRLVSAFSIQTSDYSSGSFVPFEQTKFDLTGGLLYDQIRWNGTLAARDHELQFGASGLRNRMKNERFEPGPKNAEQPAEFEKDKGIEWAAWLNDEFEPIKKLRISAGLRGVLFQAFGPKNVLIYDETKPKAAFTVIDTLVFGKGESTKNYAGLEPRISLSWLFLPENSVKFSYNRMRQHLHLISNTASATPADLWQTSNFYIRPQVADNFGAGIFRDLEKGKWQASVEAFWKRTVGVPTYKNFAQLTRNAHIERELLDGELRAYGLEFFLKKLEGKSITGWWSATVSRAFQRVITPFQSEKIAAGGWFPSDFDAPIQSNLFLKWSLSPENWFTINANYRTGRPFTAPENNVQLGGGQVVVPNFEGRNNARIPDYFRLDAAFTIDRSRAKLTGTKVNITASVYNLLGRQNAFSVFYKPDPIYGLQKPYKFSVIGAAVPAVSLNFTF